MNALYRRLAADVDLWIAHSAIYATNWVWPYFAGFSQASGIEEWLLTPNISAQTSLNIARWFSKPSHKLHHLFK